MSEQSDRITRFVGLIVMAASALWTAFSGYCVLDGIIGMFSPDGLRSGLAIFVIAAGVIGMAIGYGVMRLGYSLWQRR